jgi:predicted membrane-bound dolichyl-phosphate-mannose-protein mannosyltransferase
MVSFSIVAMMLYLHKNHLTAGVFSGLAIASKIMGFLSTWTMIILDVWTNRGKRFVEIAGGAVVAFIGTIFTSELIMTHTFINPVAYIAHLTTYATAIKNLEDLPNAFIWFIKYKNELFVDGSTTGFWLPLWFLSVPLFVYAIYKAFHGSLPGKVITSWLVGFYLSWCVMAFVIGRGSYIYYQLMVVPCIYLALAFALNQIIQWSKERYGRKRLLSQR